MDEIDLIELKKKIEKAKQTVSELKGQKTALLKTLKSDWKCSSTEEANKLLTKMSSNLENLNRQIKEGLADLEEKYEG